MYTYKIFDFYPICQTSLAYTPKDVYGKLMFDYNTLYSIIVLLIVCSLFCLIPEYVAFAKWQSKRRTIG